jgi:hypothetical protein
MNILYDSSQYLKRMLNKISFFLQSFNKSNFRNLIYSVSFMFMLTVKNSQWDYFKHLDTELEFSVAYEYLK